MFCIATTQAPTLGYGAFSFSSKISILILLVATKKFESPSEGAAEGGCGGNSAAPERSAGAKRRRSIRVLRKMGSDFFKQTPPILNLKKD